LEAEQNLAMAKKLKIRECHEEQTKVVLYGVEKTGRKLLVVTTSALSTEGIGHYG